MTHLFPEIIADILCRLPVKSLLRFRCVSKSWGNQIDDPYFIKLHLNHSLKTNTNLTLILAEYYKENLFSVDLDTLHTAIKLNNPIEEGGVTQVLGSCNGLVALLNSNTNIALWNPSTRTYHKLPAMPLEMLGGFSNSIDYGFGYDPVSDDYKLVRIVLYDYLKKPQVEIYSLKSNSWRRTRDFPYCRCYDIPRNGTLANNTLHWRVRTKSERDYRTLIVAFDLRVEEYFEVPQLDYIQNNIHYLSLESLGGCLCVVCHYGNVSVDIWVMQEYRVKESWIKVFSIQRGMILKPLAYSKSGDRVLLNQYNGEKFVWYDLRSKRAEKVRILGAPKSFEVKMCVASLVPLIGGQQAGGN